MHQNEFIYDSNIPYFSILVPTADTTRYRHLLGKLMHGGHNVLFMGETGVGKSVVISSFLTDTLQQGKTVSYTIGYSAQTKPVNVRDVLETKLEKKRKNLLGPPSGKKMFLFIDDLNMPALEVYGAQPPNELLRQVIDRQGFYDVKKLFFKAVQDVVCVAACAPPGELLFLIVSLSLCLFDCLSVCLSIYVCVCLLVVFCSNSFLFFGEDSLHGVCSQILSAST